MLINKLPIWKKMRNSTLGMREAKAEETKGRINMSVEKMRHLKSSVFIYFFRKICRVLQLSCLVPRRLCLDENLRAKEGRKEKTGETALRLLISSFPLSLALRHQSLAFLACLHAKNEVAEDEPGSWVWTVNWVDLFVSESTETCSHHSGAALECRQSYSAIR